VCKVTAEKTIDDISRNKVICFCHENFHWKRPEKYKLFNQVCDDRDCDLRRSLKDWLRDVKTHYSKVPICCRKCDNVAESTRLGYFVSLGALGCGCSNKSENVVRVFLKKEFGEDEIIDDYVHWCVNPKTNRRLAFDMITKKLRIIC